MQQQNFSTMNENEQVAVNEENSNKLIATANEPGEADDYVIPNDDDDVEVGEGDGDGDGDEELK